MDIDGSCGDYTHGWLWDTTVCKKGEDASHMSPSATSLWALVRVALTQINGGQWVCLGSAGASGGRLGLWSSSPMFTALPSSW